MKTKYFLIGAAILCLGSCASETVTNYGELTVNTFNAWVEKNRQAEWEETSLGSWVVEWDKGDVESNPVKTYEEYPYVRLDFTISDLNGTVGSTSDENLAKQLGTYDKRSYYGPDMTAREPSVMYAGIEEVLNQMGVGGHCKVIIPGWLLTGSRYDSREGYIDAMTELKSAKIYEFTVRELVEDTALWQMERLKEKMGDDWERADSLAEGVYYVQDQPSDKPDTTFASGNSVYINYICRRIDGTGVDTNIADSAKVFGCYSSSSTYEPVLINWADTATEITMTSNKSNVISGFAMGIFNMRPHEKGRVYMTSDYAYGSSGSGSHIPGFCPIYFELEFVDEPEDE